MESPKDAHTDERNQSLLQFCRKLPKIELHAHLNGSMRTATMDELCIQKNLPKLEDYKRDITNCFQMFDIVRQLATDPETILRITNEMIEDYAKDDVRYLEIRTGPKHNPKSGLTKHSYMEAVIAAMEKSEYRTHCHTKLLLSVNREESLESAMETVKLAREFPSHVVGIDFSGNPWKGTFSDFIPALEYGRQLGCKLSVHFAEVENAHESHDMLTFRPDRLAHANFMNEQIEYCLIESKIPLEVCLTSNVITESVPSFEEHHFRPLRSHNHPMILCTDDSGVFSTTLSQEYFIAGSTFGLSEQDLFTLAAQARQYIFDAQYTSELDAIYREFAATHSLNYG